MDAKALAAIFGLIVSSGPAAAEPAGRTQAEITHLFAHLRASGCEFFRNGSWYAAPRAAEHLSRKYEYLAKRGLAPTTEAFIERAATKSSVSGKPYQVRCAGQPVADSGKWFTEALARYRAQAAQGRESE
jgi:hypothetical protein